jgi:hypothetical protein
VVFERKEGAHFHGLDATARIHHFTDFYGGDIILCSTSGEAWLKLGRKYSPGLLPLLAC